jgi:dienelactone hydrolase
MANRAPSTEAGFRAALAFYPACWLKGQFEDRYVPYAPVRVFHGTADEEVSPRRCGDLVERSRAEGGTIEIRFYPGASHGFDDPGGKRQSNAANAAATEDAVQRSLQFFAEHLEGPRRNRGARPKKLDRLSRATHVTTRARCPPCSHLAVAGSGIA